MTIAMGTPTIGGLTLSFTKSKDWFYRHSFSLAGLQSVCSDLGEGTTMHCWVPKSPKLSYPNLVLVHGFGANAMWQYAHVLPHFIPKFNVFVPDLVFFGRSYTSRNERTEEFQARCLMKLMQIHGVEKMSFVGNSYGSFVGYTMATLYPDAVHKAVLCSSGVSLEETDMDNGLFRVKDLEEAAQILVPQTPDKLRELIKLSFVKPPKGVPNWILSDFINPTMIICGDQDQVFPLELNHRLQRHLGSNAQLVVVKNAGHALNTEKSKEFVKYLKSFLIESHSSPSIAIANCQASN